LARVVRFSKFRFDPGRRLHLGDLRPGIGERGTSGSYADDDAQLLMCLHGFDSLQILFCGLGEA